MKKIRLLFVCPACGRVEFYYPSPDAIERGFGVVPCGFRWTDDRVDGCGALSEVDIPTGKTMRLTARGRTRIEDPECRPAVEAWLNRVREKYWG